MDITSVKIPQSLYNNLGEKLDNSQFNSVDDLVTYILQDYLDRSKAQEQAEPQDEEQAIQKRLKNLGYL